MIRWLKRQICKIKGHRYEAPVFFTNMLFFCKHCGAEMFGRTFADLEPMTEEERQLMLDSEDWWR